MSLDADAIYALLPAIHRTRDADAGGPLQALIGVIAEQVGVLEQDLRGLYADAFIETCSPWAIPYIGALIGWTPLLPNVPGTAGGRAELANTIGYRRRKGTVIALEQLGADVTGRAVRVVEAFRGLAVDQSFRHLRPEAGGTIALRDGAALARLGGPFESASRTIDVRRIAPRVRDVSVPDTAALDVALHGDGRCNIPDIAAWVWRWISYPVTGQPGFRVDARRFMASPLGADMPLFNAPAARTAFDHLTTRADVAQPIGRREFHDDPAAFYREAAGLVVTADGVAVPLDGICVCDLSDISPGGDWPDAPSGKVAIDPVLGRIAFPPDQPAPGVVVLDYCYGFAADLGGGPYDRTSRLPLDASRVTWQQIIGAGATDIFGIPLTLADAVAAFNAQPAGTVGLIVLAGFGAEPIALTGPAAIAIPPGSELWIVAAEVHGSGDDASWSAIRSRATLSGDIEIVGIGMPSADDTPDSGQVFLSGVLLAGTMHVSGQAITLGLQDCTLVPGRALLRDGEPAEPCTPSLVIDSAGATLTLERVIAGPVLVHAAASARITDSIVDAMAPWNVAFAGPGGAGEGGTLHVEDSTIIGKVRTHLLPLASNTIFLGRRPACDPWPASVWCTRRQSGCVRFCFVPADALTPPQYRCLPGGAVPEEAVTPIFVSRQYGSPSYALLSGFCPVAIWQGADDGSQIGAFHLLYETQGVANLRTRFDEYLPFNLEAGIFLIPSSPEAAPLPPPFYGTAPTRQQRPPWMDPVDPFDWLAIGAALI
ncbi:MAG TPA: hypothetical protein VME92_01805 [Acetobacteraceae bacterium]|nr:hypothetical protein [Acetobacteraceae bacterium]